MEQRASDRRLVMRVLSQWRGLAGERGLPRRSQIDPRHFGQDWANCLLIDVDPEPRQSRLAFIGELLRDPTWPTFDRQCIAECIEHTLLHSATCQIDRVIAEREPLAEGAGTHVGTPVLYRSILLPLSEDGRQIDGVLGAVNCREI
ncbi:MAG: PAS domain-containing protein [Stellaceae bacterium]